MTLNYNWWRQRSRLSINWYFKVVTSWPHLTPFDLLKANKGSYAVESYIFGISVVDSSRHKSSKTIWEMTPLDPKKTQGVSLDVLFIFGKYSNVSEWLQTVDLSIIDHAGFKSEVTFCVSCCVLELLRKNEFWVTNLARLKSHISVTRSDRKKQISDLESAPQTSP